MNMQNPQEVVDQLIDSINSSKKAAIELGQKMINDPVAPLTQRWELFVRLVEAGILPEETYGDGFIDELDENATLYDDFNVERHETVTYPGMYSRMLKGGEWDSVNKVGTPMYDASMMDAWREKVLAAGYGSFTYDW